ncbi:23S rRNA (adenine(2030)-N(6))-methyltransferase RlmJ [Teredinibacter purpureus]|uniref:23S rRNA (adenine(2030)-N(6))-methyltransferase RlmJ n=1 Tax=Teredinibacter purpureus TaxID=2731756 RepID=UPI0005F7A0C7|nr:23S rRNA (adenine(2030)-N(6))-methyltransferase RlmJ [Teredinibacter purpureus]
MLSYRHSFHAGNFADVIKHIVQIEILDHLCKKDTPFAYIDTHSGAGLYDLRSESAAKLGEYQDGVAKLWAPRPDIISRYLDLIASFNASDAIHRYPGSPLIAQAIMRSQDRSWLYELHPQDFNTLSNNVKRDKAIRVHCEDGLTGVLAHVPPVSRRGLILIDPSYEVKTEYEKVFYAVTKAYKKFSTGIFAIWYPVVERSTIRELERRLANSGMKNIQRFELGVLPDTTERGMTAAGMFVVNTPWGLMDKMQRVLPLLKKRLALDENAFYTCDSVTSEFGKKL